MKLQYKTIEEKNFTHEIRKKNFKVISIKTKAHYLDEAIKEETEEAHEFFKFKQKVNQPIKKITRRINYNITHYG